MEDQQSPGQGVPKSGLADLIRKIHINQRARGFAGRSAEEIEAGLNEGEAEYEEKMRKLRPQADSD